jgi:hypothetical protein
VSFRVRVIDVGVVRPGAVHVTEVVYRQRIALVVDQAQ